MNSFPRFRAAALPLAAVLVAACTDRLPTDGGRNGPDPARALAQIDCTASVQDGTVRCGAAPSLSGGAMGNVIVGGQHQNVRLASSNARYDGTSSFEVDVTVQNLLGQVMGTTDGSTVQGVRVFFYQQPTASVGTGEVEVANEDGSTVFVEGAPTPYFAYDEILQPRGTSQGKTWRFTMPSTVSSFRFSVFVDAPVPAETGVLRWERVSGSSPVVHPLNAVWVASDRSAFAVGDGGTFVHYDGASWSAMKTPLRTRLNGVWGAGPAEVYAVGDEGVLMRYGGNAWSALRTPDANATLRGVHGAAGRVVAVGTRLNGGRYDAWITSSTDGGATWKDTLLAGTANRQLNAVWTSGGTILAAGLETNTESGRYDGIILRSTDGGASWTTTVRAGAGDRNLRGVWSEGSTIVVVGQDLNSEAGMAVSVILRSTDGGATWNESSSAGTDLRALNSVWGRDGVVYAVGTQQAKTGSRTDHGLLLRSTDGGATWGETVHPSPYGQRLMGVAGSADGDRVFAVGNPGLILVRTGEGWSNAASIAEGDLRATWATSGAVFSVGRMVDFAARTDRGLVLRSTDGGASWSPSTSGGEAGPRMLRGVAAAGGTVVAVGSQDNRSTDQQEGVILRSIDGGDSWTETVHPMAGGDEGLMAVAAAGGTMIAVGYTDVAGERAGLILRSTDGGATWTRTTKPGFSRTLSAVYLSGGTVVAVGSQQNAGTGDDEAVVLRSSDGGVTWTESVAARPRPARLFGVWVSGSTVVAVGSESTTDGSGDDESLVLRSTDGGATWSGVTFTGSYSRELRSVWGDAPDDVYAAGSGGTIRHFDGTAWTTLSTGVTAPLHGIHGVSGASSSRIYAAGNGLTILAGTR